MGDYYKKRIKNGIEVYDNFEALRREGVSVEDRLLISLTVSKDILHVESVWYDFYVDLSGKSNIRITPDSLIQEHFVTFGRWKENFVHEPCYITFVAPEYSFTKMIFDGTKEGVDIIVAFIRDHTDVLFSVGTEEYEYS